MKDTKNAEEPHSGDMFIDYSKPNDIKPRSGEMNFAIPLQLPTKINKVSGREFTFSAQITKRNCLNGKTIYCFCSIYHNAIWMLKKRRNCKA